MIVSGTLLRAGNEIRVATQLTEAATGTLLWSHDAQAPVKDLFQLQDELTQRIVTSLSLPLTHREQQMLRHDVPSSPRAYEYFLRGNQLSYDPKQWHLARDLYLQSVAEDPRYAPAWARLGRIHHVMGKYLPAGTHDGLNLAETALLEALALNPDLPFAHKLYAQLEVDLGRALDGMSRLIERAHTADPELLAGLVSTCRYCGLLDASLAAHGRAVELDPKIRTSVQHTWFMAGDHARMAADVKIAEFPYIVSLSLAELGRGAEALPVLRELEPKTPTRIRDFIVAGRTLLEGNTEDSIAAMNRVAASEFQDPEGLYYVARHLAHLKQTGPALEVLGRVVDGGFFCHPAFVRDPWLDSLRKKPAFAALIERAATQHHAARERFEQLGGSKTLGV